MPKYCQQTLQKIRKNSGPYENMPDGIQPWALVLIVFVLVIFNCVLVYCYRRHTKREMRKEMNHQIETAVS
jgi:cbb3-type cytochrome oxidase subunit 3